ncbi:MAG: peptide ABC transporter substrate-binding protein [Candidatus Eremiobacteraeota bacterium]|nr:peptide ABC transporter substrate-binding protein [Candidatus Eremiobacteraeota bacterium]
MTQLKASSLLIVTVAVFTLATGCTKISTQTSHASAGNPWTKHGILRVAAIDEPDNLDPMVGNQQAEVDLSLLWGSYLYRFNDRDEWVPELATEVPTLANGGISRDGLAFTYHLRRGVKWQDGATFSADDVIFSWQQVMNPRNNVTSRGGYDDITRIEKKGPDTIVVHLRKPYAPFLSAFFSMGGTPMCILPKHLLSRYADLNRIPYNLHPIGTGPFMVQSYEKGNIITFVANPSYFRGPPKIQKIYWHFIPDSNTLMTQLRTHEIDAWFASISQYLPTLQNISGIRLFFTPLTAYSMLGFNVSRPMLRDKIVRQALAYAVDRPSIADKVYHKVRQLQYTDQPRFLWAYNPNTRHYDYDPQRAARMLEMDGWKLQSDGYRHRNGQRLTVQIVTTPGGSGADNVIIQQSWRRIGVDAPIKVVSIPLYFATYGAGGIIQTGNFDVGYFGWYNGADPDDSLLWMCDQMPPNGQNAYRFCNHELDAQEQIALTAYDQATRKRAYFKIQDILTEEEPVIFMLDSRRISSLNTDFKNYKPSHAVSTLWNPWEWEI